MQKILFLYTELAEYFLACLQELEKTGNHVMVVHWPVNPEAPFKFRKLDNTIFRNRNELNAEQLEKLVSEFSPSIILCSGWIDKDYIQICKNNRAHIPVVLLLDNHWKGNLKQQLARLASRFMIRSKFSHAWVPGDPQKKFALKLGFAEEKIRSGFYSADTKLFREYYTRFREEKSHAYPKRLLYIGRYTSFKGVHDLWQVFSEIQKEFSGWELWCTGTGELWDDRYEGPGIRHFGFVQPAEMGEIIRQCGIFVLPSHKEPWGVVVHEMAAAGFPLLCSANIGATSTFLRPKSNGLTFTAANREDLKVQLKIMMSLPGSSLLEMGDVSNQLSLSLSPGKWVETLLDFIRKP